MWFGDAFTRLTALQKGPRSSFMREFETIRTAFDNGDRERTYRIVLRMENMQSSTLENEHYDQEFGHILLSW